MLKLWNNLELRVLVLLSLSLQLSLSYFGRRRRYGVHLCTHIFVWFCYLVADSVAIIALSVISNKRGNSSNDSGVENGLMAFWAPFMLLHLGGQDTITAYAVQDNDLWLRHLFKLVAQSGVTIYITHRSWEGNRLSFLTILMLLAGFIKYAERIWVMRSANHNLKLDQHNKKDRICALKRKNKNANIMPGEVEIMPTTCYDAYENFPKLIPLFLNQKIHFKEIEVKAFGGNSCDMAFDIIEIELGHAYDTFYTKIPLFYTAWGCIFRCISFSSTFVVLVLFFVKETPKYIHQQTDLIITYILLVGAVFIEIYAVMLLVTSNRCRQSCEHSGICHCRLCKQTWSKKIGQFNMLSFCMKTKELEFLPPKLFFFQVWFFMPKLRLEHEMVFYKTNIPISDDLKRLVWDTFVKKSKLQPSAGFSEDYKSYISRDENVEVEIYQSIIIWHFATDLCFHTDNDNNAEMDVEGQVLFKEIGTMKEVIKNISDYMMYILTMCPFLLSTRNAKVSFAKACKQFGEALKNHRESSPRIACEKIMSNLSVKGEKIFPRGDDDPSDSLLVYYAFQVVKKLREREKKWEILTRYWVEHLGYIATLCTGKDHAKQLLQGGEFLTHVWFMIEHLDLKKSFRKPPRRPQEEE